MNFKYSRCSSTFILSLMLAPIAALGATKPKPIPSMAPGSPIPFPFPTAPPIPPGPGIPGGPIGGTADFQSPPNPKIEVKFNKSTHQREIWLVPVKGNNFLEKTSLLGVIETIPKGSVFYHWDTEENASRWARQGSVDPGEVSFLDKGMGAAGGGFYVSQDSWDSASYGRRLTIFTTTQEVEVLSIAPEPPNYDPTKVVTPARYSITDWNKFNDELKRDGRRWNRKIQQSNMVQHV